VLEQVIDQTRTRLSGAVPDGSKRIVSLHDTDVRPIRKGRLGKPVEFGQKVDGIVLDLAVFEGNPADAPLLAPAIGRIAARFSRVTRAVTADRGYGEASVEAELGSLGVKTVAIPRKGRPGPRRQATERARAFRSLVKLWEEAYWHSIDARQLQSCREAGLLAQLVIYVNAMAVVTVWRGDWFESS
jgi:IS5 family transposase